MRNLNTVLSRRDLAAAIIERSTGKYGLDVYPNL